MTRERELLEPVDLCTPDGSALNPAARGWSRTPLHRANLHGQPGRNKRWDYWAILAGDVVISTVVSNVDYIGLADVWWADLVTGETGGQGVVTPGAEAPGLPEVPASAPLHVARDGLDLTIDDDDTGTRLRGTWTERDGRAGRLDIAVALPAGHESLNVVIPWSDQLFNFTSKHQARPASGKLIIGDRVISIGAAAATTTSDAWGVLDVGRGRWPPEIRWNWGGGAGVARDRVTASGHVVGLQIGGKWTEGTGFTENGVIVDGRLTKLGNELVWEYEWDQPMRPWHVADPDGQLDITLTPQFDKHSKLEGHTRGSETHQVFGTWQGRFVSDDGDMYEFTALQGFAEEARQRW